MASTVNIKRRFKKSVQIVARWSYVVKGILFGSVAIVAVRTAIGLSRQEPNRKEVLNTLFSQPFSQVTLVLITLALAAHTLWRVFETFRDPYQKGTSLGGLLHRFTYLLSGVSYGSLAITALKLLFGNGKGSDNTRQLWVGELLHQQGGVWLVMLAGGIIISWAMVQLKEAFTHGLYRSLKTDHLPAFWRVIIRILGGIGFTTQATILTGIGYYMLKAALTKNPRQVKNMDDLLGMIQHLPNGINWLFLISAGLFMFGIFMFVMARYFPLKLD